MFKRQDGLSYRCTDLGKVKEKKTIVIPEWAECSANGYQQGVSRADVADAPLTQSCQKLATLLEPFNGLLEHDLQPVLLSLAPRPLLQEEPWLWLDEFEALALPVKLQ